MKSNTEMRRLAKAKEPDGAIKLVLLPILTIFINSYACCSVKLIHERITISKTNQSPMILLQHSTISYTGRYTVEEVKK